MQDSFFWYLFSSWAFWAKYLYLPSLKKNYLSDSWIVSFYSCFLAWFLRCTFLYWKFDRAFVSRPEIGKSRDGLHLLRVQLNYLGGVFQLKRLYEYYSIEARIKRGEECKTAFKLKYKGKNVQFFIVTVRLCSIGGEMSVEKGFIKCLFRGLKETFWLCFLTGDALFFHSWAWAWRKCVTASMPEWRHSVTFWSAFVSSWVRIQQQTCLSHRCISILVGKTHVHQQE